jgi:AcrR family transcriptional regulator
VARPSGRRPGHSGTREAIRVAAARQFAEYGYDRTSMRGVAAEAGVDQKLIAHFYGSKQQLFVAAMELPFNPAIAIPAVVAGERHEVGRRLATFVLATLEDPEARRGLTGLIRAAASEPEAARMVREFLMSEVFGPIAAALAVDEPDFRVNLVGSQVVGLVMARYVVGVEPLASAPPEAVAAAIAPTFQRYLVEPLTTA